jgi:hypothetical protein
MQGQTVVRSIRSAVAVALLVAAASFAGIVLPSTYAAETASWAAQAIGQDWVNLLLVVPCLIVASARAARGSQRWKLILGGALVYGLYAYAIYAFAVHFNRLFLIYCAILGLSFFALAELAGELQRQDPRDWYEPRVPARLAGIFQILVGALFAALWLLEIIPALVTGEAPKSLAEVGLVTNPVHVLDLSLVLPAMIAGGIALLRHRPAGLFIVPITLSFGLLMSIALEAIFAAMYLRGLSISGAAVGFVTVILVGTLVVLARLLACVRS